MTKNRFWGITPLTMQWTRELILDLIEELKRPRDNSLRRVALESDVSYDVLKDFAQRNARPTTLKFDVFNLQKLLALKGQDLGGAGQSREVSLVLTMKEISVSLLRRSQNILLHFQVPQAESLLVSSLAVELTPSESQTLAQLLNKKALEAENISQQHNF